MVAEVAELENKLFFLLNKKLKNEKNNLLPHLAFPAKSV
jgi:hypothetical protein